MLSELDSLYLDWIWQLDSVARLNNVWWANLRFDFGIWFECDLTVYLISGSWFQFMLVLWFWQLVSGNWCLVLSCPISSLASTWTFALILGSSLIWLFFIPASSQYCIFQLQVQLYFHFQLDFLLPVLVYDKSSPDMLSSSPRCNVTSPRCNALLYRFRI